MTQTKPSYKLHKDDEWYDEIKIDVVPRYKTSGMSGDEWRVSARIQIFRKGILLKERFLSKMDYACDFLKATIHEMADEGRSVDYDFDKLCFQAGCKKPGLVEYELIDEYYPSYGEKMPKKDWMGPKRRRFCEEHAQRGDCGLEDADRNYKFISGPPSWKEEAAQGAAEAASPSAVMTVKVDSLEDIPEAISEAVKQAREKS